MMKKIFIETNDAYLRRIMNILNNKTSIKGISNVDDKNACFEVTANNSKYHTDDGYNTVVFTKIKDIVVFNLKGTDFTAYITRDEDKNMYAYGCKKLKIYHSISAQELSPGDGKEINIINKARFKKCIGDSTLQAEYITDGEKYLEPISYAYSDKFGSEGLINGNLYKKDNEQQEDYILRNFAQLDNKNLAEYMENKKRIEEMDNARKKEEEHCQKKISDEFIAEVEIEYSEYCDDERQVELSKNRLDASVEKQCEILEEQLKKKEQEESKYLSNYAHGKYSELNDQPDEECYYDYDSNDDCDDEYRDDGDEYVDDEYYDDYCDDDDEYLDDEDEYDDRDDRDEYDDEYRDNEDKYEYRDNRDEYDEEYCGEYDDEYRDNEDEYDEDDFEFSDEVLQEEYRKYIEDLNYTPVNNEQENKVMEKDADDYEYGVANEVMKNLCSITKRDLKRFLEQSSDEDIDYYKKLIVVSTRKKFESIIDKEQFIGTARCWMYNEDYDLFENSRIIDCIYDFYEDVLQNRIVNNLIKESR